MVMMRPSPAGTGRERSPRETEGAAREALQQQRIGAEFLDGFADENVSDIEI